MGLPRHALASWAATLLVLGGAACLPPAASAQTPVRGMAFAAIDSASSGQSFCFGETLERARRCAVDKCRAASGPFGSCQVTSACDRSGWAGFVAVRMKTASFTSTMCGVASRLSLIVRLKEVCRSFRGKGLETCALDTVWTPAAEAEQTRLMWTPRTLGRPGSLWR